MKPEFTIRVYGILFNAKREILVSDEKYEDRLFTKFPGGGLEFGEGTVEALKREFNEELGVELMSVEHVYTTDFFVASVFNSTTQLLSIYYKVEVKQQELSSIKTAKLKFEFDHSKPKAESFRWVNVSELKQKDFTFPVDQYVFNQFICNE